MISGIVIVLVLAFFTGKALLGADFRKEVIELFASSGRIADRKFRADEVRDLPLSVQRYFTHVLKEGQPYVSYVRLRHDGLFRTGLEKDYTGISGEQYYTVQTPGFIWKGETSIFTARDTYINKKGALRVHLLSLVKIVDGRGEKYNHSELLRWLGEAVWFPTNLLPSGNLRWSPVDINRARLDYSYDGLNLFYIVDFNEKGEIVRLETERYMGQDRSETWIGRCSEYKESCGMKIPFVVEAAWLINGEEKNYGRFFLREIEYNVPEQY